MLSTVELAELNCASGARRLPHIVHHGMTEGAQHSVWTTATNTPMNRTNSIRVTNIPDETSESELCAPKGERYSGPRPSEMTHEQLSMRDSILSSRPTTGLAGPFGPWLAVPKIAGPAQQLGSAVRYGTSLSVRESELVILLTGAKFESATEFEIHVDEARRVGIGWDVIRSIPRKGFSLEKVKECVISMLEKEHGNVNPPEMSHEKSKAREVAIVLFASELLHTNTVCDETYAETRRLLDGRDSALVEITAIVGYYAFVSYTLNVFKIPSPSMEQLINE